MHCSLARSSQVQICRRMNTDVTSVPWMLLHSSSVDFKAVLSFQLLQRHTLHAFRCFICYQPFFALGCVIRNMRHPLHGTLAHTALVRPEAVLGSAASILICSGLGAWAEAHHQFAKMEGSATIVVLGRADFLIAHEAPHLSSVVEPHAISVLGVHLGDARFRDLWGIWSEAMLPR